MTCDVIDTARRARQAGGMTNIGETVAVVRVEPLTVADAPLETTGDRAASEASDQSRSLASVAVS
jgi:hypothetical protein